ncbi:hypothetical protein, partial [Escherichia coli]|uniref:hypothetical protein n=1 Tax=Escherichia coli TaxID=562 RepID=UPI001BC852CB
LAGGCAHCVNTTTFPNFFDRCVGNKKIGTPEGAPAIFRLPKISFPSPTERREKTVRGLFFGQFLAKK